MKCVDLSHKLRKVLFFVNRVLPFFVGASSRKQLTGGNRYKMAGCGSEERRYGGGGHSLAVNQTASLLAPAANASSTL